MDSGLGGRSKALPIGILAFVMALCVAPEVAHGQTDYDLHFATYLGGSGGENNRAVTIDGAGNIYVAGGTKSADFPTTPGAYNRTYPTGGGSVGSRGPMAVFVTKFDQDGNMVWSTFLGGPNYDRAYSIRVDSTGHVYVSGRAGDGFPTTPGAVQRTFGGDTTLGAYGHQDGFVTKLSPDGSSIVWSTYIGDGSGAINRDMDIDSAGNVYICSNNQQIASPHVTAGAYQVAHGGGASDALIAKISADGSTVLWASHLGGSGREGATSIRVASTGHVIVAGAAQTNNLPTTSGAFQRAFGGGSEDGWVARFLPDGSDVTYLTYIGGSASDGVAGKHGLAVDAAGNAYVMGFTNSTDFPITSGAFQNTHHGGFTGTWEQTGDRWAAKLSIDGSMLVGSTFVGGNQRDGGEGIEVDSSGRVHLCGFSFSSDFPVTSNAYQATKGSTQDAAFIILSSDFQRAEYATFFGGAGNEGFRGCALGPDGSLVLIGDTTSRDYPTASAYEASYQGGSNDSAVVKFKPAATSSSDAGVVDAGCAPSCGSNVCGGDGCGGSCGTCTSPEVCSGGACVCVPDCSGRSCGGDGCGGSCGSCGSGRICGGGGVCLCDSSLTDCGGSCVDVRSDAAHCGACDSPCAGGESCVASSCRVAPVDAGCTPDCTGRSCGDDGCGGTCGSCGTEQICASGGTCLCSDSMVACGTACIDTRSNADYCGGCDLACTTGQSCVAGLCEGTPMVAADGGPMMGADGGPMIDPMSDTGMNGGCSCRVSSAPTSPLGPAWMLFLAMGWGLTLAARRIRRR